MRNLALFVSALLLLISAVILSFAGSARSGSLPLLGAGNPVVSAGVTNTRVTNTGDTRVTNTGDTRVTNQ